MVDQAKLPAIRLLWLAIQEQYLANKILDLQPNSLNDFYLTVKNTRFKFVDQGDHFGNS